MQFNTESIPQLTYDLLARILPGFVFLSMLLLSTSTVGNVTLENGKVLPKLLFFGVLYTEIGFFDTILFLIFAYMIGWVFYSIHNKAGEEALSNVISNSQQTGLTKDRIRQMYHEIRMTNYNAGQRLVKLRAEVRMWEAVRSQRWWILLLSIVFIAISGFLHCHLAEGDPDWPLLLTWSGIKLLLACSVLVLPTIRSKFIKKLWEKYWRDLILHHNLISRVEDQPSS